MNGYHKSAVPKNPIKKVKYDTVHKEFREQTILLSDEIWVKKAAEQLGVVYSTLVDWWKKRNTMRKKKQDVSSEPLTEREKQLMKEIAELKEANEILKDAMSFFRKRPEKIWACSRFEYIFQFKQKNFESQLKKDYSVKKLCKVLTVSKTGFYKWKRNRNKPKAWQILLQKIYEILDADL